MTKEEHKAWVIRRQLAAIAKGNGARNESIHAAMWSDKFNEWQGYNTDPRFYFADRSYVSISADGTVTFISDKKKKADKAADIESMRLAFESEKIAFMDAVSKA
jgi:hypothetical protein